MRLLACLLWPFLLSTSAVGVGGDEVAVVSALSDTGGPGAPGWWRVDIYSDGRLELARDGRLTAWSRLAKPKLLALLKESRSLGLFELRDEYGYGCFDCSSCWLRVIENGHQKDISFAPFRYGLHPSKRDVQELRIVRGVWLKIKALAGISRTGDVCEFPANAGSPNQRR